MRQAQIFLLAALSLLLVCCQPETEAQQGPPVISGELSTHLVSQPLPPKDTLPPYTEIKSQMRARQLALRSEYLAAKSDSAKNLITQKAKKYLVSQLTEKVFPKWYGTLWDFNGISEKPGEGAIACGYFVSTILRDIGFNLNRYRVAQQDATTIIKVLCEPHKTFDDLQKVVNYVWRRQESTPNVEQKSTPNDDALYIVGLDQHVGFLFRAEKAVYFIHSSYADPVAVVRENATESAILNYSEIYVVGSLTGSNVVAERWLTGERISVK